MPRPDAPAWFKAAKRQFTAQQRRFFLWSPLPLMAGIMLFFSLPRDPPAAVAPLALLCALALWHRLRRQPGRLFAFALLWAVAGFASAQLRTLSLAMPLLTAELRYRDVQGRVDVSEPAEKKIKITLSAVTVEGLRPEATPPRLRITLRAQQADFQAGDRIALKATLMPLPAAVLPGGFDFARHYYYSGIGGTGYALSPAEIVESPQMRGLAVDIRNLRHRIGENMRRTMEGPAGAVAAAMTIGETGPIPESVNDSLRDSGLYHILSISGFHLAAVTGLVFAALRLLLALLPVLALRVDTRKMAGLLALLAALAYLALAGYPLPAQRSFIMVAFVLTAILCDRRGISLRSLCFAALAILLLFPESLYSASFQLSFAATLAIVSLYEHWPVPRPVSLPGRMAGYGLGMLATSLAASLATAPFVIYDFNRLSALGMVTNMLVLPLAGAVIMPAIILSLLLMPLGLEPLAYIPLQWGVETMLAISDRASGWPLASIRLPSLSDAGVLLAAFGLLWLCLWQGRLRLWGIPMLLLALATIHRHRPVDVFVSAGARQVMLRLPDGRYTLLKGTTRAYAVRSWLQSEGQDMPVPLEESGISCDAATCTYRRNGHTLRMVTAKASEGDAALDAALDAACALAPDILIAPRYLRASRCPGPKIRIGKSELESYGPHALYLTPAGVIVTRTRAPGAAPRHWQPPVAEEGGD